MPLLEYCSRTLPGRPQLKSNSFSLPASFVGVAIKDTLAPFSLLEHRLIIGVEHMMLCWEVVQFTKQESGGCALLWGVTAEDLYEVGPGDNYKEKNN